MNTPETEWENELHMKALTKAECAKDAGQLTVVRLGHVVSLMKEVRDARDTYWKERVRNEVEGMKKPTPTTHVCTDIGVTFVSDITGKEICVHWAFVEEHNKALDTLLDKLK